MSAQVLIDAFKLPLQALVEQHIAKKLFVEQGAPTAADKRLINDAVEDLMWHAALKPRTVGVAATGDVIEVALISVVIREGVTDAQAQRLVQLIHRAIPYPVLLVIETPAGARLSLADKRPSEAEAGKWVVDAMTQSHVFDANRPTNVEGAFLASLALGELPSSVLINLAALYRGYADRITALAVAQVTSRFSVAEDAAARAAQREALNERQRTLQQLAAARATAAKEKQINRRVELNLLIQRLQGQLQQSMNKLTR
jgi:hypothetical protein